MSRYAPVELLRPDHDTSTFDCGSEQQTQWLRRHALGAQQAGTARVYVTGRAGTNRVAGYHALAAGAILPEHATTRLTKGTGRHPIPIVILARLGVDRAEQGRGLGSALVRDAIQRTVRAAGAIGIRALLIHSETPAAAAFYRRLDAAIEPSPMDPLTLVLLIKDARAAIQRAGAGSRDADEPGVSGG